VWALAASDHQQQAEPGEGFVGIDGQGAVGGGEGLHDGDEVEEDSGQRCRDGNMPPAGAVIQRRGQHRQRGDTVENHRNS